MSRLIGFDLTIAEMMEVIESINKDVFQQIKDNYNEDIVSPVSLSTDGDDFVAYFCSIKIWSSVNDDRAHIESSDTYENFEIFLRRKVQKLVDCIKMIHLMPDEKLVL